MSENVQEQDRPFKATLKAGGGYEAPWLTIEATDADDMDAKLDSVTEGLLQKVVDVADLFRASHIALIGLSSPAPEAAPAQSAQGATVTQMKTCQHGVRTRKEGNNSRGKWVGYFCPERNKAAQCEPIWGD